MSLVTDGGRDPGVGRRRMAVSGVLIGVLIGGVVALVVLDDRATSVDPAATSSPSSSVSPGSSVASAPPVDPEDVLAFQRYLDQLRPVVDAGAATIVLGLRNGVADVGQSRYEDEVLERMVDGWQAELSGLREDLRDLEPPHDLEEAHGALIEAMGHYTDVADLLEEALEVTGDARLELAKEAADAGERADDTWDRGALAIQAYARALGLDPVGWLTDEDGLEPASPSA